jgi:hypothetical protein
VHAIDRATDRAIFMRAKVILVVVTTAVALLSAIYAGSEALARGGGGGRGGHGGMMSGSHGLGSHGMHGMNGHMNRFAFKGQHSHNMHDMHQNKGNRGKFANGQGMWHQASQRNNNFQGQWQVGGGGGGGSIGDLCVNSGVCQGVWQVAPQSEDRTSQSRSLQRSWHVGDEM